MNIIFLLCLSLHVHAEHEINVPNIYPESSTYISSPGSTWTISCKYRSTKSEIGSIQWITEKVSSTLESRITIEHDYDELNDLYHSVLTLRSVEYLDTGPYTCLAGGKSTTVYLWVDDKENLIDYEGSLHYVNVYRYQRVVLPCRPTHPDVQFRFFKNGVDITDNLLSRLLTYHIEEGLIIANGSLNYHNGQIKCQASREGTIKDLLIILFFKELPEVLPPPAIQLRTPRPIEGENVTLDCRVLFQDYYSSLNLQWLLPHGDGDNQKFIVGKQTTKNFKEPGLVDHTVIYRTLTILNVDITDSGMYTCQLTAAEGSVLVSSPQTRFNLKIYEQDQYRYISDPIFRGDSKIIINDKKFYEKEIRWIFDIEAYPNPEYSLITPNGDEFFFNSDKDKYVFESSDDNKRKKLVINNPSLSDTGAYLFIIRVKDSVLPSLEKSVRLTFLYEKLPELKIKSTNHQNTSYFITNSMYNITCDVLGFPLDFQTFKWVFKPLNGELIQIDDYIYEENHHRYQYKFKAELHNVIAEDDGYYGCSICSLPSNLPHQNQEPICRSKMMDFLRADSIHGHTILSNNTPHNIKEVKVEDELIRGDEVNYFLTCLASTKEFQNVSWWMQQKVSEPWTQIYSSIVTQETLSINSTIFFDADSPAYSGNYECRAFRKNSEDLSIRKAVIKIVPSISPTKSPHNTMNGTKISLEASGVFVLNCDAQGRPIPEVKWMKDGTPFDVESDETVDFGSSNFILFFKYATPKQSGKYSCHIFNRAGEFRAFKEIFVAETRWINSALPMILVVVVIVILALFIFIIFLAICLKRYADKNKKLSAQQVHELIKGHPESMNPDMDIQEQAHLLPYNKDEFEFPRDRLKIGKLLGSGEFGYVKLAQAIGLIPGESITTVAVKSVKPNSDDSYFQILVGELKIMTYLGKHLNIVNLLGAVTSGIDRKEVFIIVEFCEYGNLSKYLSNSHQNFINQINTYTGRYCPDLLSESKNNEYILPNNNNSDNAIDPLITCNVSISNKSSGRSMVSIGNALKTEDLLDWAMQITNGMEYLSQKQVVHRDLACRNILIAKNNVIKICDFGLSRNMYKTYSSSNKKSSPVPVKWLSIESLKYGTFTRRSDIWSFGVVLWEMFTLGRLPYPNMEYGNLLPFLESGKRMEQPMYCPDSIYYRIMRICWSENPSERPSWIAMRDTFEFMVSNKRDMEELATTEEIRHPNLDELLTNIETNGFIVNNPTYLPDSSPHFPPTCGTSHPLEDLNGYLVPKTFT
ncbi:vascular endothelial growth factor receptor 1 [Lepeophtheirus salmonis]|uniref:vascular endothelial growth factor receptor 1 n=1 Tax=Lepeophtheirus salmonis TaxID=72036 RepID=UPI001AE9174F|nr:vascular endothelial growth factor receptor 1-like [Lepeophtheirus salmonis]